MPKTTLATTPSPHVIIESIGGNLEVKGWDDSEVLIRGEEEDEPSLEGNASEVRIRCEGDLFVRLPQHAALEVIAVHNGARIKRLEEPLKIETVHGSLEIRDVAQVQVGKVHGNLLARQIADGLNVEAVYGNLIARDIQGATEVGEVGGNLELRDAEGDFSIKVNGNARLRLSYLDGDMHQLTTGGNLHCRFAEDISARVNLHSGAQNILVHTSSQRQNLRQAEYEFTVGSGESSMHLKAGGSIAFSVQEVSWSEDELHGEMEEAFEGFGEEFGQQLTEQIEEQIEEQMEILDQQMANLSSVIGRAGVSTEQAERIMQQARVASERASARAQEKMRKAQEKMEHKLAAAKQKADVRARAAEHRSHEQRRRSWSFDWAPPQTRPAKESVSDEERMIVLRMLQEKKISLEQAETLLAALERNPG